MTPGEQLQRMHVKVGADWLRDLDAWRRRQPDLPSRSEAVRRVVAATTRGRRARRGRSIGAPK
jgi:hypothetical protein